MLCVFTLSQTVLLVLQATRLSKPRLPNLLLACSKWHAAFATVLIILFLLFDRRLYVVNNMRVYTYIHTHISLRTDYIYYRCYQKKKGKAIPLQAWTDPEGSTMLRLPDFKTIGT